MQPKPLHGAAPGFRVLHDDAAAAAVRRHAQLPLAGLAGESDAIHRRPDRTIDMDLYRRHIAARRRVARERAALTSAGVGVLAMTAIYLALFFAAAHTRATNHAQPTAPLNATPIPGAADVKF
jgi:hypothetical protein